VVRASYIALVFYVIAALYAARMPSADTAQTPEKLLRDKLTALVAGASAALAVLDARIQPKES
jgi:hypothetical protein